MVWIERDFKDHLVPGPLLGAANKNKIMVFPQNPNKVSCIMQFYVSVRFFNSYLKDCGDLLPSFLIPIQKGGRKKFQEVRRGD